MCEIVKEMPELISNMDFEIFQADFPKSGFYVLNLSDIT